MHFHLLTGIHAELFEHPDDLVLEDMLEEKDPFEQGGEFAVDGIVVVAQGDPVADMVAECFVAGIEGKLLDVEFSDADGRWPAIEREGPVGLGKEMVEFFDTGVEAHEHRFFVLLFILDEWQAIMKSAGFIVVVVEHFVFHSRFSGDCTAEGR